MSSGAAVGVPYTDLSGSIYMHKLLSRGCEEGLVASRVGRLFGLERIKGADRGGMTKNKGPCREAWCTLNCVNTL